MSFNKICPACNCDMTEALPEDFSEDDELKFCPLCGASILNLREDICPKCQCNMLDALPEGFPVQDLRFCPICGANFKYPCPVCHLAVISIKRNSNDFAFRCSNCESILYFCEKCGRLVEPSAGKCPDEDCGGMLRAPQLPASSYDGSGFCDIFTLKDEFDNRLSQTSSSDSSSDSTPYFAIDLIPNAREFYGALTSGGFLFVWHDAVIDIISCQDGFNKIRSIAAPGIEPSSISPNMALLADNIIIASKDKYLWFSLNGQIDTPGNFKGSPLAMKASHYAAAFWAIDGEKTKLYGTLNPKINSAPDIFEISLPEEGYAIDDKRPIMVMGHHCVYWQGKNGNLFKYDFLSSELSSMPFAGGKAEFLWLDYHGRISAALSDSVKLIVYEDIEGSKDEKFYSFDNFVTNLLVYSDEYTSHFSYILDNRVMKNGDGKFAVPNGDHVKSFLVRNSSGIPFLLSLFKNTQFGNLFVDLYAQEKDSGAPTRLWGSGEIDPKGLLLTESSILVLHRRGVLKLERKENL